MRSWRSGRLKAPGSCASMGSFCSRRRAGRLPTVGGEENWPQAAAKWGPAYPVATGRTMEEYRDLVRSFITRTDSLARPRITIETSQPVRSRSSSLAPRCRRSRCRTSCKLADRRFDGHCWHRWCPTSSRRTAIPAGMDSEDRRLHPRAQPATGTMVPCLAWRFSGPEHGADSVVHQSERAAPSTTYTGVGRVVVGRAVSYASPRAT